MRVAVIGGGAIGSAVGTFCAELGLSVAVYGRAGLIHETPHLRIKDGPETVLHAGWHRHLVEESDLVFFCCKAHQLEAAIDQYGKPGGRDQIFVSLVNGAVWPLVQKVALKSGNLWRLGIVTFGVRHTNECFEVTKSGTAAWSADQSEFSEIERHLFSHPRFEPLAEGLTALRRKWLFNVVVNTLCGAQRLKSNGELLKQVQLVEELFAETWELGQQLHGPWPFDAEGSLRQLWQLIEATQDNENSMARDVRLDRGSEVAFLSGLATDVSMYPLLVTLTQKVLSNK